MSHLFYLSTSARPMLDRAEGIYMWDTAGRRFIDGSSGAMVSNIGHSNPRVLAAMKAQMDRATFGYRLHFETEPGERLAEKVASLCPAGMEKVFFVSGGSEAVESAVKLARQYAVVTGQGARWKVISRFPSYHGSTLGALSLTGYDPLTDPFRPLMVEMPKIPAPRAYLDGLDMDDPATGALVPPAGYMQAVRRICDRYGILLIHDEVMSGGGRVGAFLGGDLWGVVPDILAISKGFGAGYAPLGAMVAQERIVDAVQGAGGFLHGHTYAGNPLACSAGLAVLEEIERQDMMANCRHVGTLLKARLEALMQRFGFIGDVRGKGLLLAFELVADRQTMAPLPPDLRAFDTLVELAYEEQLIIYSRRTRGGRSGDHFLLCPPMITIEPQVDEIMEKLTRALTRFADAHVQAGQLA